MGYSTSRATVRARTALLSELAAGRPTSWTTAPDMAVTKRLAFNIREALRVAAIYPDEFPELAQANKQFSIFIPCAGRVEARIKTQPHAYETPMHGVVGPEAGFKVVPQVGITTAKECIDSWNAHLPSSDPLLLQRTSLIVDELVKLYTWSQTHKPRLMFFVGESHITISLYEAEAASIAAWTPPAPNAAPEEFFDL